jgi:hypothetical protein
MVTSSAAPGSAGLLLQLAGVVHNPLASTTHETGAAWMTEASVSAAAEAATRDLVREVRLFKLLEK